MLRRCNAIQHIIVHNHACKKTHMLPHSPRHLANSTAVMQIKLNGNISLVNSAHMVRASPPIMLASQMLPIWCWTSHLPPSYTGTRCLTFQTLPPLLMQRFFCWSWISDNPWEYLSRGTSIFYACLGEINHSVWNDLLQLDDRRWSAGIINVRMLWVVICGFLLKMCVFNSMFTVT